MAPSFAPEFDEQEYHSEIKMLRAAARSKSCHRKRAAYARSRAACSVPPRAGEPHRAVRAATRTCLARGSIEADADLPSISMADRTRPGYNGKRACVSPMLKPFTTGMLYLQASELADLEAAWDGSRTGPDQKAPVDCGPASESTRSTRSCADSEDLGASEPESPSGREGGTRAAAEPKCSERQGCGDEGGDKRREEASGEDESQDEADQAVAACDEVAEEEGRESEAEKEETEVESHAASAEVKADQSTEGAAACAVQGGRAGSQRREEVLLQIVSRLREQAVEASRSAEAAKAEVREVEQRARAAEASRQAPGPRAVKASLKQAQSLERQMASDLRKKRHQAQCLQALKDKADRTLYEAKQIKERAQDEAAIVKARHMADADIAARAEADARMKDELLRAQAEAQEEMKARLEAEMEAARRQAEDEASAIRAAAELEITALIEQAEREMNQMKAQAEAEAKAKAAEEVRLAQERAEGDAREVKARAEADARALKERVLAQLQERAEAEAAAQRRTNEERRASDAAQEHVQAQREASIRWRQAKALDKQRAQHIRRQAQSERQQEHLKLQELEAVRVQAAKEAQTAKEQALAEARATTVKANAKARATQERARRELASTKSRAEAEAVATKSAAEAEAQEIRTKAEEEALALRAELELARSQARAEVEALREEAAALASPRAAARAPEADWEVLPALSAYDTTEGDGWNLAA